MATFAGKGQQVFMATVMTFDTGETIVRIAAIEVAVDDLLDSSIRNTPRRRWR